MRTSTFARLAAAAAIVALAAPTLAKDAKSGPRYGTFGVDLTTQDKAIKPGDDFWTFANGAWNKRTQIAADRTSAGYWVVISDEAEQHVRDILTDLAANPASFGASGKQIGDLYASWMDQAAIDARGTTSLQPYLAKIAAVQDKAALQTLFASVGYASPVELGQLPNPSDPTRYVAAASQGGLGMGGRDYYLLEGAKYDGFRKAYRDYVIQMQTLAGIPDAATKADAIIALETAMAKEQWSPERQRNLMEMFKPMDRAGMKALAPQFDWDLMLKTAGLDSIPTVIMATSTALTANGKLLDSVPLQTWKDWVAFRFVSDHAQFLPKAFDDASFAFYGKTLRDQPTQRDRWKRGVALVNGALGEAVGQIYVARYFPPESEAKMGELIGDLRGALGERLTANSWMDAKTKAAALAKLDKFDPRIGHPAKYIDYASLKIDRGDLLGNAMRSGDFQHQLDLDRLTKPVDRSLWDMTPQTVNAYYNPLSNQITFPAAILQPPFFDPKADAAVNYGAIGAVIGHEIGHGFDDQGSLFDGTGKISNWWTPESKKAFTARTAVLGKQYDGYEPIPGTHIKGSLTMGENIGDLGGVEMAYAAYQRYQAKHGKAPVIGGLTGDQRFFLAWAQVWQEKDREGALRQQLLTNAHSPAFFRVNGVVRNVDAWYTAFNVKPGDKLYLAPADRVHIW
ncbi:endothelin-converting enzyme/putative endopeptidase [Sphingomonas sp. BE270]|jgi:putative endopeptidase|uniref:M13 family metallopeptidase n=3 Tax=Pseudomonadota TaxID=1224 RepID=UPI00053D3ADF|nr:MULTISPECIES: M13 family metallopeptidase [unclassified Sphingomonas]MDR6847735.1 endothelin-converting enzyme/putative endopeptidase [Sphingomonas sp. BE137]MDR7259222.1 endothelin-converting enzyme/putative endopeptidase [Sphingomonas sp. BE270]